MTPCERCGNDIAPADSFCGSCGLAAPTVKPAAVTPPPNNAPPASATSRRSPVAGVAMIVLAGAIGLATLAVQGVFDAVPAKATSASRSDKASDADPAPSATKLTTPRPPPVPTLSEAREVDRPSSFAFTSVRENCARTRRLTDEFKDVGLQIDEAIRRGSSLSEAEEIRIGRDAIGAFTETLGGRITSSGRIPAYFTAVAAPMVSQVARQGISYHFYLWDDTDTENAFALPGGHIVVSKPLFDRWTANEAQLATVLGHEIGHVDRRHPLAVLEALRALGMAEDDEISQFLVHLARIPYSAAQESSADAYGGRALHAAGYSIFQSVVVWDERAKEAPARRTNGDLAEIFLGELENLLQTHPDADARACQFRQLAHDLYRDEPRSEAYVGKTNRRDLTPMSMRTY